MYNTNLSQVRSMLKLFNIIGLIFSVLGTVGILYAIDSQTTMSATEQPASFALIVTGMVAMCIANVYFTMIILTFVRKASDDELIANRYILSVFSIGIQGVMTPFILSNLPNIQNVNNDARKNPKFVIGKHYGMAGFVLTVATAAILAIYGWQFNVLDDSSVLIAFYVLGGLAVISLISLPLFWLKSSEESFKNKTGIYKVQIVFAIIALVIATAVVVWIMLLAVLRLLQNIQRALQSRDNMFMFILSLLMVFMAFWYVQFVWTICITTLRGIWSSPNSDALDYKVYTKMDERKEYERNNR